MVRPAKTSSDPPGLYPALADFVAPPPDPSTTADPKEMDDDLANWTGAGCGYMPWVSAFHDGELTGEDNLRLCAHVHGCQACGEMLAFLERVSRKFAAAGAADRLGMNSRHAPPERTRQRSSRPADVRWARRLTAMAAALFLAAVARSVYVQYNTDSDAGGSVGQSHQPVNRTVPDRSTPAPPTHPAEFSPGNSQLWCRP